MTTRTPPEGQQPAPRTNDAKAARLKAALKANLQRRKAQSRARNGQASSTHADDKEQG